MYNLFPPCTLPYKSKKLTKNPLNYYSLKVTKFHGDSVKNESAWTKKTTGGRQTSPPSQASLGLSYNLRTNWGKNVLGTGMGGYT